MQLGELKPILAALALPPAGPLLLALAALALSRWHRRAGNTLAVLAIAALAALSCNAVAVALAHGILPQVAAAQPRDLQRVQAIVVLGGGVEPEAPEYGSAQLGPYAYGRLRYGAWLAKRTGKPLAYAGGQGWSAVGTNQEAEAQVARRLVRDDYGVALRWQEGRSRDTRENADFIAQAMRPDGIRSVAVVTDSWHMPRALHYFRAAGFEVVPAPTGFPHARDDSILEWIPSAEGLLLSRQVLREWLALRVAGAG
ncbi:MAG: hypothetical protein JWQ76_5012 [Ramlibacter sp.]|nr:hypothetical protein [Ramlibacter sp.]